MLDAFGFPAGVKAIEDPRLLVHHGELLLQVYAYMPKDRHAAGRQFLTRLERQPASGNGNASAVPWHITQASERLLRANVSHARARYHGCAHRLSWS